MLFVVVVVVVAVAAVDVVDDVALLVVDGVFVVGDGDVIDCLLQCLPLLSPLLLRMTMLLLLLMLLMPATLLPDAAVVLLVHVMFNLTLSVTLP